MTEPGAGPTRPPVVADPSIVPVGPTVVQVCPPVGGTVLIVNLDLVTAVYCGYRYGIGPSNAIQIPALGSAIVDGTRPIYAFSAKGQLLIQVVPGGSQWTASPAEIALQIQLQGIPILASSTPIYQNSGIAIAPLATLGVVPLKNAGLIGTLPSAACGYLSYEMEMSFQAAAAPFLPFVRVTMQFWDALTDPAPVDTVTWKVGVGSPAVVTTFGKGPLRGQFMTISMTNLDAATTVTLAQFTLNGTSRTVSGDDWRDSGAITILGSIHRANGDATANNIGYGGAAGVLTLPASSNVTQCLFLFSGQVRLNVGVTAGNVADSVVAQIQEINGAQLDRRHLGNPTADTRFSDQYVFPRGPITILLQNNDAGAAASIAYSAMALVMQE